MPNLSLHKKGKIQHYKSAVAATGQPHYDVIVIGGGPNGLVAAAYLAKAGRRVLLLEKREMIGGIAVTEEFFPGYKVSALVDEAGFFSPAVVTDLNLTHHGLETISAGPLTFSPQPDGGHLTIWPDTRRTLREIEKFSHADAIAYPGFIEMMRRLSNVMSGLNHMIPPDLPDVGLRDMIELLRLAKPVNKLGWKNITQLMRVMTLSISDLLDEWFESDIVKGAIGASAVKYVSCGPQEAGTAYTFLYDWSCSNNGLFHSSVQARGGLGGLTQTLAHAAESFGVEIRTNCEVAGISTQNAHAYGVKLANEDQISAKVIVSATDVRTTFLKLIGCDHLDAMFVQHLQNIRYNGTLARVHFSLDGIPAFTALNGSGPQLLSGHIQLAPSLTYVQKAYDPVKYGRYSTQPYLDIRIPTLTDSSLAPDGGHLMSVSAKYTPYRLQAGDWDDLQDTLAQLVMETITGYAPDFPQRMQQYRVITPLDMELVYSLPEGDLAHGGMSLDRFLWMRPVPGYAQYRAPVEGLYLCSNATHPGGGVTGINGKNAARDILREGR